MPKTILSQALFRMFLIITLAAGLLAGAVLGLTPPAFAAIITVNTFDDELNSDGDCSLREAVEAANSDLAVDNCTAGVGADTIILASGRYTLTGAAGDDINASGDLDISGPLTINGTGAGATIIDGGGVDRVLHIQGGANVEINNLTITNGRTPDGIDDFDVFDNGGNGEAGGGILIGSGGLTIINSEVTANATGDGGIGGSGANGGSGGLGGGIANAGALVISNSAIVSNTTGSGGQGGSDGSGGDGGGIVNFGMLVITNSTISENSTGPGADSAPGGDGGGVLNRAGTFTSSHNTVANNSTGPGGDGGGVFIDTGTAAFKNTILADNAVGAGGDNPDCLNAATLNSLGYNLVEDTGLVNACSFAGVDDQTGPDPLLAPLADNGGRTQTHALQAGSPALDAGSCSEVTTDQRGRPRPFDITGLADQADGCDIGAFEAQFSLSLIKTANTSHPILGHPITYTLTLSNAGDLNATNALISDTLPVSLTLASSITINPPQAGAILATSAMSLPTVASNVTITYGLRITLTLPVTGSANLSENLRLTNTVELSALQLSTPLSSTAIITLSVAGPNVYLPALFKEN